MSDTLDVYDTLVPANRGRPRECWQHTHLDYLMLAARVEDWRRHGSPLTLATATDREFEALIASGGPCAEIVRANSVAYQRHRVTHQKPTRPPRPKRPGKWERDLAAATLDLHG